MGLDRAAKDLRWTGERYVPYSRSDAKIQYLHRYHLAAQLSCGKRVLGIACGEGYGSEVPARSSAHVIGVQLSDDSVAHAFLTHRRKNLQSEIARRMLRDLRFNDGR
jgi:O-antigen biosynthesis protein